MFVDGIDVQSRIEALEATVGSLESTVASLESVQTGFNARLESTTQDINFLRAALTMSPTQPTAAPTTAPSTAAPTTAPSVTPTLGPTAPTSAPTVSPSGSPSGSPTIYGYVGTASVSFTKSPTLQNSKVPSFVYRTAPCRKAAGGEITRQPEAKGAVPARKPLCV